MYFSVSAPPHSIPFESTDVHDYLTNNSVKKANRSTAACAEFHLEWILRRSLQYDDVQVCKAIYSELLEKEKILSRGHEINPLYTGGHSLLPNMTRLLVTQEKWSHDIICKDTACMPVIFDAISASIFFLTISNLLILAGHVLLFRMQRVNSQKG